MRKDWGKIDFVEFGSMKDYPFQLGSNSVSRCLAVASWMVGKMHCKQVSRLPGKLNRHTNLAEPSTAWQNPQ